MGQSEVEGRPDEGAGEPEADPDEPYENVQMIDLDDHLKAFTWHKEGDVWIYAGTCPRCEHGVTKRFIPAAILAFQESEGDVQERTMRCDCGETHAGRESGSLGCGAWWGLGLSPQ